MKHINWRLDTRRPSSNSTTCLTIRDRRRNLVVVHSYKSGPSKSEMYTFGQQGQQYMPLEGGGRIHSTPWFSQGGVESWNGLDQLHSAIAYQLGGNNWRIPPSVPRSRKRTKAGMFRFAQWAKCSKKIVLFETYIDINREEVCDRPRTLTRTSVEAVVGQLLTSFLIIAPWRQYHYSFSGHIKLDIVD